MANKRLMTNDQRELLKLFLRVAEAVGGVDLRCRVADSFTSDDPLSAARLLNDQLDGQREKGVDLSIKSGKETSNLSFKDVDDEDFLRSLNSPALNIQNESGEPRTFEGIDDDTFLNSIKETRH